MGDPKPPIYGLRPDLGVPADDLIAQPGAARDLDVQRRAASRDREAKPDLCARKPKLPNDADFHSPSMG